MSAPDRCCFVAISQAGAAEWEIINVNPRWEVNETATYENVFAQSKLMIAHPAH
jgi:hypothetical protein